MKRTAKHTIQRVLFSTLLGSIISLQSFAQDVSINGHVVDETGHPLMNAKVYVNGNEFKTDHNGDFNVQAPLGTKIKVKYPGHGTEVKRANQKMIVTLTEFDRITWNARVGINMGAIISNNDNSFDEHKIGFQIGAGMEYAFTKNWVLQPSLMLYKKTYKDTTKSTNYTNDDGTPAKNKWVADMYVGQLNILAGYRFRINNDFGLVIAVGPSLGYSFDGTLKKTLYQNDKKPQLTKYDIFDKKSIPEENPSKIKEFDRFNIGVMGSLTAEYKRFFLTLESGWEEHNTSAVSIGVKF